MRLEDLTKNLSNMTDDELREHVRQIRHNKNVVKPASAKRVAEVVKKESNQKASKVNKMLDSMSESEKRQLLLMLEGD